MKKCILPFVDDVEMKVYQNKAFVLGVMKANFADYEVWLCNKFINLVYCSDDSSFDIHDNNMWLSKEGLTEINRSFWKPDEFYMKHSDIIENNKKILREGIYITGAYDEFFIPGKAVYQKKHFCHDYILYGYDDDKNVFKSAAYLQDGKYQVFDIDYRDYYDSLAYAQNTSDLYITYRRINKAYRFNIDMEYIKKELENFLLSRSDENFDNSKLYGIDVWKRLELYIQEVGDSDLDNRYGRLFMEHKRVMQMRINMLCERGFIKNRSLEDAYNREVCRCGEVVHRLFMKYNIKKDPKIKCHIVELIHTTTENEKEILGNVLNELKDI